MSAGPGTVPGMTDCGWWVGPIWKLGGETCVCYLDAGHELPHRCTCGSWFEGCGHPPGERHPRATVHAP